MIKKDKYLSDRGGIAKIIDVSCMICRKKLFTYQKDGPGWLKRCYLNRILDFHKISNFNDLKSMPNLTCSCGEIIGTPMKHKDGRFAFRLIRGKFKRTINKKLK
ncbi:MAG: hypothetical protein KJ905_01420 [Nanoarchaeota archaeon]|nr:hypothetical protein [Nanoarchaeota archaeon]MBU1501419.1 hypothetical protein [Nanoarchaeota archaeon]